MKLCPSMCCIAVAGALLVAAMPQDAGKPAAKPGDKPAAQDAAAMPDMSTMMPNEHHAKLAKLVGEWKINGKMLMPGMPPESFSGKTKIKTIIGGRFVMEEIDGDPMPMGDYEGMGISGYDNRTGKYQYVWLDNTGTAIGIFTGEDDPMTGHVTWRGEAPNMMTGAMEKSRTTGKQQADGTWLFQDFRTPDGGTEALVMEITYSPAGG